MPNFRISLEPTVLHVGTSKDQDVLVGSKCKECERYFFPSRIRCGECAEPTTEPINLSKKGNLTSFALITRKPKFAEIDAPYILGEVLLPEGIRIYSLINSKDPSGLVVNQEVTLDTLELKIDQDKNKVIAYAFSPTN